ncbi:hypothetical protein DUNSADRAFT_1440, partial [Dunaliella salina]
QSLASAARNQGPNAYASNSHFVFELIQNAEDANFEPGVKPWIGFELSEDAVHVAINEVGFSFNDMDKLCSMSKSSKRDGELKIGNKGIGFKSVFKVTAAPAIYSNDYRVKFDIENDRNGFSKPIWNDACPPEVSLPKCRTHYVLPLLRGLRGK